MNVRGPALRSARGQQRGGDPDRGAGGGRRPGRGDRRVPAVRGRPRGPAERVGAARDGRARGHRDRRGSDTDLLAALRDLLPADDRWRHRHGSHGHGRDHVLRLIAPSMSVPVLNGRTALGTWQSICWSTPTATTRCGRSGCRSCRVLGFLRVCPTPERTPGASRRVVAGRGSPEPAGRSRGGPAGPAAASGCRTPPPPARPAPPATPRAGPLWSGQRRLLRRALCEQLRPRSSRRGRNSPVPVSSGGSSC